MRLHMHLAAAGVAWESRLVWLEEVIERYSKVSLTRAPDADVLAALVELRARIREEVRT